MQGTRRIVLVEPGPRGERDASGQPLHDANPPTHVVWAIREAGRSDSVAEGLVVGDVLGVEAKRAYRFAADTLPQTRQDEQGNTVRIVVDEDWSVIDEDGVTLDIAAVMEATPGARRRWLKIVCERTDTRRAV